MVSECTMTMKRGTKRKIEIKKRDTKQQRSVACSKRRQTLFSKAADLCLHSGANIAAFVTSPAENSDVVYSFSGFTPASEIADCYLNGKSPPNPQSKLGFWWEDPDLYRYCDDVSELNIIEDRLMRTKKHLLACLEKQENSQSVSNSDQNPSTDEIFNGGSYSSQIASDFGQKPSSSFSSLDQNPKSSSPYSSQIASFEQNSYSSSFEPCSQNPTLCVEDIYGESSYDQSCNLVNEDIGFVDSLWETEKENNRMSLCQETNEEDRSLWENLLNMFGLSNDDNIDQVPVTDHSSTNEEEELMIDISDYLNEEEIEFPQLQVLV